MLKEKLIGAQVLKVSDDSIAVSIDGTEYTLEISTYQGGCCGFAESTIQPLADMLKVHQEDTTHNPVITDIKTISDYDGYSEKNIITFFGESQELFEIAGKAGSGSGWGYGATVSIVCDKLELNEIVVDY